MNRIKAYSHYTGIFVISMTAIAYQVILTRLFSVTLHYHFAFAGISLAMLGLTTGAEKVYKNPNRFSVENLEKEWARAAIGFALSSVLLALWFLYCPMLFKDTLSIYAVLTISMLWFIIPFFYSGICVTLILTKSPFHVGRLYAADLIGAATGCIGIVLILFALDPVSVILLMAFLSVLSAMFMTKQSSVCSKLLAILLLVACTIQSGLYLSESPHLRLIWAKAEKQENVLFERWNTFSHVAVMDYKERVPFGWGFGKKPAGDIEQKYLRIDADAGTVITRFDGDTKPLAFLADDIINTGYLIRPVKDVAVIGVGGGRDIMSAIYFGAKKITGIEINPAIFEAITKKFADFTGNFYKRPDVTLINAEARSWLTHSKQTFDLIQISLIDTWAATAAGGLTLSENKLYTVEAWREFLDRLNPDGMLVVSRWFDPKLHKSEFYRLLALASESLEENGVSPSEVKQHILAFNTGRIITVAVSKSAFTANDIEQAKKAASEHGFTIMMSPDHTWDETSGIIVSGKADKAFYDSLPFNVTPPTDDLPFFFYSERLNDMLTNKHAEVSSKSPVGIVIFLLLATFVCALYYILQPVPVLVKSKTFSEALPLILYFAAIGLGFMLIKISQMQHLMIYLGHPMYGLSVVLFTLLLFGGIGSLSTSAKENRSNMLFKPLLLLIVLILVGLGTPLMTGELKTHGTFVRIILSVFTLAPAAFCMGTMFPTGMLLSKDYKPLQPCLWGINGVFSVFASVLGVVISMQYGISATYWTGVACYLACFLLVYLLQTRTTGNI